MDHRQIMWSLCTQVKPFLFTQMPAKETDQFRKFRMNDWEIWTGKSAQANDVLTWEIGSPDDFWFHVDSFPGAHVRVFARDQEIPDHVKYRAAELALFYSKAPRGQFNTVTMTLAGDLTRDPTGVPGLVYLGHLRTTLEAAPFDPEIMTYV